MFSLKATWTARISPSSLGLVTRQENPLFKAVSAWLIPAPVAVAGFAASAVHAQRDEIAAGEN